MDIDVLVFGSANIDCLTYVTDLPKPGETLLALHRERCFGGKGANQCVAASKLGAKCALISKLGNDEPGEQYLEYLQELDINVEHVERVENTETGLAEIIVADNADNTIIVVPGANSMLTTKDVTRLRPVFKQAKVLICQLETDNKAVLCAIKNFKGVSILNASPVPKDKFNMELIKAPTILCVNEVEAAQLTNRESIKTLHEAKAAANDLIDKGAKSVIITMGEQGAVHLSRKQRDFCTHCPAASVRYLADTSGAGDAFLGSLAYHIASFPNLTRESHISAANICAAYAVGHRGTQPSFPGTEYVQKELCRTLPTYTVIMDAPEAIPEEIPITSPIAAPVSGTPVEVQSEEAQEPQEPEAEVKAEPEAEAKPEPEPEPEAKAEPEPEPMAEPEPEAKAEPEPELELTPDAQERKSEPKPVPTLTT